MVPKIAIYTPMGMHIEFVLYFNQGSRVTMRKHTSILWNMTAFVIKFSLSGAERCYYIFLSAKLYFRVFFYMKHYAFAKSFLFFISRVWLTAEDKGDRLLFVASYLVLFLCVCKAKFTYTLDSILLSRYVRYLYIFRLRYVTL